MKIGFKIRKIFQTGDVDFSQVIYHSAYAFVVLGTAIGLQFFFDLLLARSFGAEGAGIFYLSLSILSIASLLSRLGLERSIVRFLAPLNSNEMWLETNGLIKTVILFTSTAATIISIVVCLMAPVFAESVFFDARLTSFIRIFALAVLPFSLMYVYAGILKGLKLVRESLIVERVIVYLGGIASIFTLGMYLGLSGVLWGFLFSSCLAVLIGRFFAKKKIPKTGSSSVSFDKRRLFASSIPLLLVSFSNLMFGQVNVLVLGVLSTVNEVGIFNITFKISMVIGLTLVAINSISAAKISELYFARIDLQSLASKIAGFAFLLSLPVFAVMVVFPKLVLVLFGDDFVAGSTALILLAVGQLLSVATGSTGTLLAMTGYEKTLALIIGFSVILNTILSILLIPIFGILGAACAVALSMVVSNIIQVYYVKRYLDIWSLPFKAVMAWLRIV